MRFPKNTLKIPQNKQNQTLNGKSNKTNYSLHETRETRERTQERAKQGQDETAEEMRGVIEAVAQSRAMLRVLCFVWQWQNTEQTATLRVCVCLVNKMFHFSRTRANPRPQR